MHRFRLDDPFSFRIPPAIKTKNMRFSIEQERPGSPFTFQLLSDNGDTLLTSGTYELA